MKWKVLIAVVVLALVAVGVIRWTRPADGALAARELATRGLAAYLAQRFAGQCAVVVSNPFTKQKGLAKGVYAQEEAGLRGLRKGFGSQVRIQAVTFPEMRSAPRENALGDSSTPLSFLVADGSFDKIAREHSGCDLIVSLIGLPADVEQLKIWEHDDKHAFALLLPDLRVVGDLTAVRKAIQSGKIAAFVWNKPGAPPEQTRLNGEWQSNFEKRFILVTKENFEETLGRYPQLFQ